MRYILLSALSVGCRSQVSTKAVDETVNQQPMIMILSHADDVEFVAGEEITVGAVVNDGDDAHDSLEVAWSIGDQVICDWNSPDMDGSAFCTMVFTDGDEQLSAEVIDPSGASSRTEIFFSVLSCSLLD